MFQEKIANRQLFNMFFIMRSTIVVSTIPVLTAAQAKQDAWLAAIITFFSSAVVVYLIGRLAVLFPGKSMVQYSQELLGVWPGRLLSLFYPGLFLFIGATDLRIYGEVLRSIFLPETPLIVILGGMLVVSVLVVNAGLEPLGRMSDLILPVFILVTFLTLFSPAVEADFSNLQPVLSRGWRPVLFATITPTRQLLHNMPAWLCWFPPAWNRNGPCGQPCIRCYGLL